MGFEEGEKKNLVSFLEVIEIFVGFLTRNKIK